MLSFMNYKKSYNRVINIKQSILLLAVITILGSVASGLAQERFTADYYFAAPEKYNGKGVVINVGRVLVPAIYANNEAGYRDYLVTTCAQKQMGSGVGYTPRGEIVVRVPSADAEAFVRRHGTDFSKMMYYGNSSSRVKQVQGTFRQMVSAYGGYIDLTKGIASNCEPRVCWIDGRYVVSPNSGNPPATGQVRAEH
jgi:hypothetical protein